MLKTPVRCLGGKLRFAPWIIEHLPLEDTLAYVEPFGGSGAVLVGKPPSPTEIYNDLDEGLVNFFRTLQNQYKELGQALVDMPHSKAEFANCRNWRMESDPVERARQWFYVNQLSFTLVDPDRSGFGPSNLRSFWTAMSRLWAISARLEYVEILCEGWEQVFERFDAKTTLFYCDPPSPPSIRPKGIHFEHELSSESHNRLISALLGMKGKAAVTGYRAPEYEALETNGWQRYDKSLGPRFDLSLWVKP